MRALHQPRNHKRIPAPQPKPWEYLHLHFQVQSPDGTTVVANARMHALIVNVGFCLIVMSHQAACGSVSVSNLPVLTEFYKVTEVAPNSIADAISFLGSLPGDRPIWFASSATSRHPRLAVQPAMLMPPIDCPAPVPPRHFHGDGSSGLFYFGWH